MRKRFVITLSRESDARTLRLSIDPAVLAALVFLLLASPVLFVAGSSWGARQVIAGLARQNASLRAENANYREATARLVEQAATLQAAAEDLGARASLDPDAARAMSRLPPAITNRAMGGSVSDVAAPLASVLSSAEPAFGLLRDVLHLVERKLDDVRPGVERREALAAATPSIWPVAGWLSSAYGRRRDPFTGAPDFHKGLDISADHGQPVRATADGVVTVARRNGDFGNLVSIDHGFSIETRYAHLSTFAVTEGQRVSRGDVIGYVGSTGRSTSPHVHYEIALNGRVVNPVRLLGH